MLDLRMDKPTLTGRKYSMKSTTMMYVDKILDIYTADDGQRKAHIFEKLSQNEDRPIHYGCRYYNKGVFQFDEFYPNKSLNYAESAAQNWCNGVKNS